MRMKRMAWWVISLKKEGAWQPEVRRASKMAVGIPAVSPSSLARVFDSSSAPYGTCK
jgi:hypothetical protein